MVYPQVWDLDSLAPNPETDDFRSQIAEFETRFRELASRAGSLPEFSEANSSDWVDFLNDWATAWGELGEFHSFIGCHAAADAGNKAFQRLEGRLSALSPVAEDIVTTIELSLQEVPQETFDETVGCVPALKEVAFYLRERKIQARYRLPKEQELLAAELAVDGLQAWSRLYDRLSGELRVKVMERGELVEKSPGQIQFDDPQRTVRENNFYASSKAWKSIADTCADGLNHLSGTRLTIYQRLGVTDHLDVPLAYNRMQRKTLETMWAEISAFKPKLVEYLNRKAELLGVDKLAWYDQTAPLPAKYLGDVDPQISYDEACDLIIDSFSRFSPDFGDFAKLAIDDGWIEAESRAGKRQGGFCTGFALKQQSRIFMTYNNTADSMSTLAHELGHAYHSWVLKREPLLLQDYPMNLAETASTFAETVLGEARLKSASPASQLSILDGMLSDAVSFLMNIHTRFLFEDRFHRERKSGEISAERYSDLMREAQKEAYLDSLDEANLYPDFWISKLHFYIASVPFYNFPYTFGYLLSLGVFSLSESYGETFPERYRQLLINTGCMQAEEAVAATFDRKLEAPEFWRESLSIVGSRIDRFLELSKAL